MPEAVPEAETKPQLEIKPEVGRIIDVLDIAERIARAEYGTSIDGLRRQGEEAGGDYSKIVEVVGKANEIVGPEDEYVADYKQWQETKQAGSHTMGFDEWRRGRREAYRRGLERMESESIKR